MKKDSIFKNKRTENYTVICNNIINDNTISWKAKGILSYLLSKPSDWTIRINDIVKKSKDGKDSIYAGIIELKNAGYIVGSTTPNGGYEYGVYDEKCDERAKIYREKAASGKSRKGKAQSGKALDILSTNSLLNTNIILNTEIDILDNRNQDRSFPSREEKIAEVEKNKIPFFSEPTFDLDSSDISKWDKEWLQKNREYRLKNDKQYKRDIPTLAEFVTEAEYRGVSQKFAKDTYHIWIKNNWAFAETRDPIKYWITILGISYKADVEKKKSTKDNNTLCECGEPYIMRYLTEDETAEEYTCPFCDRQRKFLS